VGSLYESWYVRDRQRRAVTERQSPQMGTQRGEWESADLQARRAHTVTTNAQVMLCKAWANTLPSDILPAALPLSTLSGACSCRRWEDPRGPHLLKTSAPRRAELTRLHAHTGRWAAHHKLEHDGAMYSLRDMVCLYVTGQRDSHCPHCLAHIHTGHVLANQMHTGFPKLEVTRRGTARFRTEGGVPSAAQAAPHGDIGLSVFREIRQKPQRFLG
jgi:hypothetical protein